AISDKANWAFIYTWSDYTEHAMAPSTFIGFVPYDLNTYYSQWFKTGCQPKIVRDTLYYFYRRNHSDVDPGKGVKWSFRGSNPKNEIELLAFLTAPGALSIQIDGQVYEKEAPAGIVSFKVPLPKDKTFVPEFSLRRNGDTVLAGKGRYTVLGKVELYQISVARVICPRLVTWVIPLKWRKYSYVRTHKVCALGFFMFSSDGNLRVWCFSDVHLDQGLRMAGTSA
ncbi:MAG: endo-1,3-alpha-glucanase family glycosylhydrolase, partial [Lentisphaerota bacterium]